MKKFSKILSVALLVALVLSLGVVNAFAATGDYSITVTNDHQDVMSINGKDYKAYKVFDLTLGQETKDDDGNVTGYGAYAYSIKTSDWAWSTLTADSTTNDNGIITTKYGIVLTPSASDPTLYSVDGENADARALADALVSVLPADADGSATAANETATIELSAPGYYAVYGVVESKDPSQDPAEEVVAALALTTTDPTAQVKPKATVPPLDKKITGVAEGLTEVDGALLDADGVAAVAKVGSTVSFQLDSKVPDLTGYDDYTYIITDTMTSGLTPVKDSFELYISGVKNTTINPVWNDDTNSFTLTIPFATLSAAAKDDAIVVKYNATVNSSALTVDKEINTASLEYSNNPNDDTTNHTPDKKVYVLDITIDVLKTDGKDTPKNLAGAKFKLYREVTTGNGEDAVTTKEYYKWADNKVTWVAESAADVFVTGEDGHFTTKIQGLDKGNYFLLETEAPTGYNLLKAPVAVVITANEGEDSKVTYAATYDGQAAAMDNEVVDLTKEQQATAQPLATGTVVNNSGTELPSTGGIGTTIFYVVGGVLVLAAIILLVTKKRMSE